MTDAAARVVATAGHVDHGKSTLLRALTGMEPDRWAEERDRGLSLDLGFVWTTLHPPTTDPVTVAFVDVPGHERFVANMLAGAGAVRLALFVVAADDGWSAQSQEHLDILDLLEVEAAVAAVTKSDLAGLDRAAEVAGDVGTRLAATSLGRVPVVLTDAVSGRGVEELAATLADRLAQLPLPTDAGRPRLWLDRSFTIGGAGTVVTGTLDGGALTVGQQVALLPGGVSARVRGLHSLGVAVPHAAAGTRTAVNLAGVDRAETSRGDALVADVGSWTLTRTVDAWVRALPGHAIAARGAWHLHVGSAETLVQLDPLLRGPVRVGQPGYVRLRLERALPLQLGDRFVLRDTGRRATAGGGTVVDTEVGGTVRGADQRLERAAALDEIRQAGEPARRLRALVAASGGARRSGPAHAAAGLEPDVGASVVGLTTVGDWLVADEEREVWTAAINDVLAERHAAAPESPGAPRSVLAAAARGAGCPDGVATDLPEHLVQVGALTRTGAAYALATHAGAVEDARADRRLGLLSALSRTPLAPPPLEETARSLDVPAGEVQTLVQRGEIVRCGPVAFAGTALESAIATLRRRFTGTAFTAAEAKDAWATTRKYAIPLLEHLDATGITTFDGRLRRLR